ncbi:hypothetical protein QBC47DRAFT_401538 [Echria macrotheca]|uniref:Uncharacterized protein n=1 Tax=Echria macrotheca TaxID=438768 RepID=A0AAJ0BGY5_9PEZI|nr:hypothetical protein QBC47DRAFT_401538 [Echria macrotheca]
MSRAMARMCSGQVYLVTDIPFPFDLKAFQFGGRYWPNIWASTEYPELRNRIAAGMVDGGALIVIEFATVAFPKPRAWKIDWEALVPLSDTETAWKRDKYPIIPAELWEPYDLASELPARSGLYSQMESGGRCDMTDTGLDSEPAGMDFFG